MRFRNFYLILVLFLCSTRSVYSLDEMPSVRIPTEKGQTQKLPDRLIVELLRRGNKYRPVYPYADISSLPLVTRINNVRNGDLDIFFALATPDYENEFQAIYIPIYRGVMGMRLAIVKRQNRDMFAGVKTISDLQHLTAGQGKLWADSDILEHNGVPVVRELKYTNLFRMLEADRFDYLPRGFHEPWGEVDTWRSLDLVVDEHIMLWYKVPFYFFVSKSNQTLANHLTEMMEEMIADGSFTDLFMSDVDIQQALKKAKISDRTVIKMDNPFLTRNTPVARDELWFNPMQKL